jgi:KipI family sensor histidine kinase inhibitor
VAAALGAVRERAMSRTPFRVRDVRDGVVLADLPESSDEDGHRLGVALARAMRALAMPGLWDAVPAARSVLFVFDPLRLPHERLRSAIAARREAESDTGMHRTLIIPVAYGHGSGDLEALAQAAGLSPEEFARRHGASAYRVAFLGFAPGFAYLSGLPEELTASRLASPRKRVPAGSLAIGGRYTGIYPEASPGGWRLIGQTTIRLLDPHADPPALLRPGDRVRFEAVHLEDLPRLEPARVVPPRGVPVLRIISPGLMTTVQGIPLDGWRSSGVPPGGAMDPVALARANARVGNPGAAPGLEIALLGAGPELEAVVECVVACEGDFPTDVNGRGAPAGAPIRLAAGDRLRLGRARRGAWGYVAVRGGLEPPSRLPPRPPLAAGDRITRESTEPAKSPEAKPRAAASERPVSDGDPAPRLRVLLGPEADAFPPEELERFFGGPWRVSSDTSRRGLRLEGPSPLSHRGDPEIPPSGTVPGSIQVPGGGSPIVLGPDGPVTGGYPRIATVIDADLPLLGRAAPGATLRFVRITLAEAIEARLSALEGVS